MNHNSKLHDLTDSEVDDSAGELTLAIRRAGYAQSARSLINEWRCWNLTVRDLLLALDTTNTLKSMTRETSQYAALAAAHANVERVEREAAEELHLLAAQAATGGEVERLNDAAISAWARCRAARECAAWATAKVRRSNAAQKEERKGSG